MTAGWLEVLCNIYDSTPPEQGPVQCAYLVKDLTHAILYHFHGARGSRIRSYRAQMNGNGETTVDNRDNAIRAAENDVNGQPRPLMRNFAIPSASCIFMRVGDYPTNVAVQCYYAPTKMWYTVKPPEHQHDGEGV